MIDKKGFSLIELMIVVAIIGILAAIVVPNYQTHIRKSRRQEAMTHLLQIQLMEERYRSNNTAYANASMLASSEGSLPTSEYYTYTIPVATSNTYTLQATANSLNNQASDAENGTSCTPLTLDQTGTKTPSSCWSR